MNRIRTILYLIPFAFIIACGSSKQQGADGTPDQSKKENRNTPRSGKSLGKYEITFYWLAEPSSSQAGKKRTHIVDKSCKTISKVSRPFFKRILLEGTGKLSDGRVVTKAGRCRCRVPCFIEVSPSHAWGAGVMNRPLVPFRSVAVDTHLINIGQTLYIEEFDGMRMQGEHPWGDFVHDGCVLADDRGHGVEGKQIDFFIASRSFFRNQFRGSNRQKFDIRDGGSRCTHLLGD